MLEEYYAVARLGERRRARGEAEGAGDHLAMAAVRLYAALREAAGQRDFEVDLPAGAIIGELLKRLIALRPKLDGKILDDNGRVPQYVAVFVNGRDIRHLEWPGDARPARGRDRHLPARGGWTAVARA